jgi:hypothetical protein
MGQAAILGFQSLGVTLFPSRGRRYSVHRLLASSKIRHDRVSDGGPLVICKSMSRSLNVAAQVPVIRQGARLRKVRHGHSLAQWRAPPREPCRLRAGREFEAVDYVAPLRMRSFLYRLARCMAKGSQPLEDFDMTAEPHEVKGFCRELPSIGK